MRAGEGSAATAGEVRPSTARGKSYSTNVLMAALGISRGTLRYYEQLGILRPQRDPDSNYRSYSNADVFRVVECMMLKNAGYQVQQAKDVLATCEDAGAFVDTCLERSEIEMARATAVHERFQLLREVVADPTAPPRLMRADEWLVYYDGCEGGYDRFVANEAQDSLLEGMPVSSFAAVMDVRAEDLAHVETRWGRAIPAQYRHLMPVLDRVPDEPARFGDCACVAMPYAADEDKIPGFDASGAVRTQVAEFMRARGLRQAGPFFAPCVLPVRGRVYTRLYLPVEPASLRGRAELARVR